MREDLVGKHNMKDFVGAICRWEEAAVFGGLIDTLWRLDFKFNMSPGDVMDYTKSHAPKCVEEVDRMKGIINSLKSASL